MTTNANTAPETMQLAPYIYFYGRCEEVTEFYKAVFGGTCELMGNGESPL